MHFMWWAENLQVMETDEIHYVLKRKETIHNEFLHKKKLRLDF